MVKLTNHFTVENNGNYFKNPKRNFSIPEHLQKYVETYPHSKGNYSFFFFFFQEASRTGRYVVKSCSVNQQFLYIIRYNNNQECGTYHEITCVPTSNVYFPKLCSNFYLQDAKYHLSLQIVY